MRGIVMGSLGLFLGIMSIVAQATGRYGKQGANGYLIGGLLLVFSIYRIATGIKRS